MHGKKYVVISQEEYENLKNKHSHSRLENPEKSDLHRSETEMKNVLNKDIPSDEKIRLFTDEFNNLKVFSHKSGILSVVYRVSLSVSYLPIELEFCSENLFMFFSKIDLPLMQISTLLVK